MSMPKSVDQHAKRPNKGKPKVIVTPPRRHWPDNAFNHMETGAAPLSTSEILDFAEGIDSRP